MTLRPGIALLWVVMAALTSSAREPFPYSVAVKVRFDSQVGSERLIENLEKRLAFELSRRGCYREVVEGAGEEEGRADLLALLTLGEVEEETIFEATVAQRERALDPETRRRLVAEFSAVVTFQLVLSTEQRIVRSSRAKITKAVRPIVPGHEEDWARREARARAVDRIVDIATKQVCKGSSGRLAKEIEQARAAAN